MEPGQEALPQPAAAPAPEATIDRRPGAVALGEIAPGGAGVQDPENPVKDTAMIPRGPAAPAACRRQQGRQPSPLLVGELVAMRNHHRPVQLRPVGVPLIVQRPRHDFANTA